MHVKIKDAPVPPGYTLTRCDDTYTREQFIAKCARSRHGDTEAAKQKRVEAVEAWLDGHKKDTYTDDDVRRYMADQYVTEHHSRRTGFYTVNGRRGYFDGDEAR